MNDDKKLNLANILRKIARYGLLSIGLLVFVFAALSGSEEYGGGIQGIVKNLPNAIPWLTLLLLVFISWRRELFGGILTMVFGIALIQFFNAGPVFFVPTFIVTLIVPLLGACLVLSWYLRKTLE